jgi:hypothetical protein
MSLKLRYFSVSMLINRLYLYIRNKGDSAILSQLPESKNADSKFAAQYVILAKGLIKLLSENGDITRLYRIVP